MLKKLKKDLKLTNKKTPTLQRLEFFLLTYLEKELKQHTEALTKNKSTSNKLKKIMVFC